MSMMEQEIDIVVLWVDGNDPAWQAEFVAARQRHTNTPCDASAIRYRDWGTLRYWFRGVERFAPWVRKIHFVTWGHLPAWLDTSHPKLHIVRHEEYLPETFRPTFNSNTLELNLHRIEGLAEKFVLFNDDTFLTAPCSPDFFFRKGLPCDMARLSLVQASSVGHTIYNCLEKINRLHSRKVLNRHWSKWLAPCYGASNLTKTLLLLPWSFFPGFHDHHLPQPYCKEQFRRAWERWGSDFEATSRHHFRELSDLSHWLIRYDMLCRGDFAPHSPRYGKLLNLDDASLEAVCRTVEQGRYRMLCLNDSTDVSDFRASQQRLETAFQHLLPHPCSYEK